MRTSLGVDQQQFLEKRFQRWAAEQSEAVLLREKLLATGGLEVVAPPNDFETDIFPLIKRGKVCEGVVHLVAMSDNSCHQNTAQLWRDMNKETFGVGTGYALHDGLWRQHSWAVDGTAIVETTSEHELYFGVVYYGADARRFSDLVLAPPVESDQL